MGNVLSYDDCMHNAIHLPGMFFVWPHKVPLCTIEGAPYHKIFDIFQRDHSNRTNLVLHVGALAFQLTNNFGLLCELDKAIGAMARPGKVPVPNIAGVPLNQVAVTSASLWCTSMMFQCPEAPVYVRLLSCAAIIVACRRRHDIASNWQTLQMLQGLLEVSAIGLSKVRGTGKPIPWGKVFVVFLLRTLLHRKLSTKAGCLRDYRLPINIALAAIYLRFAQKDKMMTTLIPFKVAMVGWVATLLTDQPALHFWFGSWLGLTLQGIAHEVSGQESTIEQLTDMKDELSHATFFPNLVLHACHKAAFEGK